MVYSGTSFTPFPINYSVLTQHKKYYSVKKINYEVNSGFTDSLFSASVIYTADVSPTPVHNKCINFI